MFKGTGLHKGGCTRRWEQLGIVLEFIHHCTIIISLFIRKINWGRLNGLSKASQVRNPAGILVYLILKPIILTITLDYEKFSVMRRKLDFISCR